MTGSADRAAGPPQARHRPPPRRDGDHPLDQAEGARAYTVTVRGSACRGQLGFA